MKRWEGRYDNFVFGLLPDDFDLYDETLFNKVKKSKLRTINQSLRTIGEKISLPFNLHYHCSRHTFATLSLNQDVDLNIISTIMGHSSTSITQKVYSKYLPETLVGIANEKLNFSFA